MKRLWLRGIGACAVVTAVSAILMAQQPQDPKEITWVSNLRQLGTGVMMYMQDYDEKMPRMKTRAVFQKVVIPYVKNTSVFTCAATSKPYAINASLNSKPLRQ